MSKFIILEDGRKLCPKCGSLGRTRRLWNILENKIEGKQILHFSPSKSISKKLESVCLNNYVTTDYAGEFDAKKHYNIEKIEVENNKYDYIICYHILEHIQNDVQAMRELYRVLKLGGTALIQTPFKKGETCEDSNIKTSEERKKHFGQADHLRIYSVEGLMARLRSVGFETIRKTYGKDTKYGFKDNETIIFAKKQIKTKK